MANLQLFQPLAITRWKRTLCHPRVPRPAVGSEADGPTTSFCLSELTAANKSHGPKP
jgi:hypothetical protein